MYIYILCSIISNLIIMKYTTYLSVFFIACTLLTSCKKDDETETTDPLIGTWQLEQVVEGGKEATLRDDCDKKTTLEIKSDNTFASASYTYSDNKCSLDNYNGTWKKEGTNTIHIITVEDGEEETEKYTYSIANGKLTMDEIVGTGEISYKMVLKKIK